MATNFLMPRLASMLILKRYSYKRAVLFLFVPLFFFAVPTFAATPSVAVIYPELRAPYNKIFSDIADGVEMQVNGRIKRYMLKKNFSVQELNLWLKKNEIKVCVALGVRGEDATYELANNIPVILGGVLTHKLIVDTRPVISLAPSPDKLFSKVKKLKRNINKIIVVYNPGKMEWLIRKARSAADKNGLELVTYSTGSLSESAKIYQEIFKRSDIKNAAIWLPPDSLSVDNRAVLSFILEQSWAQRTPVFSSRLSHVNKGVLFAMYPDNVKLGQSLGKAALDELNGNRGKIKGIVPAEDLQTAINRRTAEHLGMNVSSAELRNYDAVFPTK